MPPKQFWLRCGLLALWIGILTSLPLTTSAQSNGVMREVFGNFSGSSISDLTNHPSFPNQPILESIEPFFESPPGYGDNYGQRLRALLLPPATGNYKFWIASDDQGVLYLSTDDTPARKVLIARVNTWTASREWTKETNQESGLIPLTAGQRYYIEALQKEGGGGDNLAVRWQLPGGAIEEPIPASRMLAYGLGPPQILRHPTNVTVVEGGTATFSVQVARAIGAAFQWYRNEALIAGATEASYTLFGVTLSDSNSRFRCRVSNSLGTTNSNPAVLTVQPDTTRPALLSVVNLGDPHFLTVTFTEPVETASATQASNYALNQNAQVLEAAMGDAQSVILTTSPLAVGLTYQLTVNHVRDRATAPNTIATNAARSFTLNYTPLSISRIVGNTEPIGPCSRRTGLVISEIMYHPRPRPDGRNLEFVELYNSQEWPEEISGYRLSGQIDYTFPSNTVINSRSHLVVAAAPEDVKAVYRLATVFGPFTNSLANSSGTVRLRNRLDAILLEAGYDGEPPYPAAADGAGHSLVLARPSFGERNALAWAASDRIGGSPGVADAAAGNSYRNVLINEFLAHTDPPALDFVELFNYSSGSVNVGGCILTDDPHTNKFVIPTNTFIPARGFLAFDQSVLGFALSSAGETIYFKNPNDTKVLDAVRFSGQANGIATGRYPDGAPIFSPLAAPSPGTNNTRKTVADIVINEIMYHPISGENGDEFVELYNRGTQTVDLARWKLTDGISYTFPANTILGPDGYLVVARDRTQLLANYPELNPNSVVGNFSGTLANGGEHIALTQPDTVIATNEYGVEFTNTIRIIVDEVTYGTGGRWGRWSDGGGSSLELVDARAEHRLAPNWADSDEIAKSSWVTIEHQGVLDHGQVTADTLQIFLLGAGECLVDDVEVIPNGEANVVLNGSFSAGFSSWTAQGNQGQSGLNETGGFDGSLCLHLRATGRGDTGANRVWVPLSRTLAQGSTATIRAKVRWLKGSPEIMLRLRGSWLEATGRIVAARNLGTPGARNSQARANAGPAITDVLHNPILPAAGQTVTVSARVDDPDGLSTLQLRYRVGAGTNYTVVSMAYNGAGFYSAALPGNADGTLLAFYLEAQDNSPARTLSRFPADAPERECLIRFGDPADPSRFGTYRLWLTPETIQRWSAREKLSNDPLDSTFVYGNTRVIYNAGAQYSGSPWHSPGYNSPIGSECDYVLWFPEDDHFLNDTDMNLLLPGNGCCDGTLQREQTAYWLAYQMGLPFAHRRHVAVFVNGVRRSSMLEDAQQPNRDMADQWYPAGEDGNLHKIQTWFEFDAPASGYTYVGASIGNWTTTGGQKKLARYRWNWASRAFRETANDYTNLFAMMDAAMTSATGEAYTRAIASTIDVDQWFRTFVVEHIVGNWDSYGNGGGQNMYTYKPRGDTWKMLIWDIDFAFAAGNTTDPLMNFGDPYLQRMADHPPFQRLILRAYQEAANGPLQPSRVDPVLDARYNAFLSAGLTPESPAGIKSYIAGKRDFILSQLASYQVPFALQGANQFSTNRNLVILTGTAPLTLDAIRINGVAFRPHWTSSTEWNVRIALETGTNALAIQGLDTAGNPLNGATRSVHIAFTGVPELPNEKIVINELMYHPRIAGSEFIELYNTSSGNAFDLSNWELAGLDFTFPEGTILEPGAFLVVARDRTVFAAVYGNSIPVVGEFRGGFDQGGETIRLLKPGATPAENILTDEVTYDDDWPWPLAADGQGPSLQLLDPSRDNQRVSNWQVANAAVSNSPQQLVEMTHLWRYHQTANLDGINWIAPEFDDSTWSNGPALLYVESATLPAPKNTPLTLGRSTYYFRTHFQHQGDPTGASFRLATVIDDGAVFYLNGEELFRLGMPSGPVSYATSANRGIGDAALEGPFLIPAANLRAGDNVLAVEVHQNAIGSSDIVFGLSLETSYQALSDCTPGAANSVRRSLPPFPPLWLNEILPQSAPLKTNNLTDHLGEADPWIELYHGGTNTLSLNGFYLTDTATNLARWAFPSQATLDPGEFLIVWLDGEPVETTSTELHANFRPATNHGTIALVYSNTVHDFLTYRVATAGRSYGSYPDGRVGGRRVFFSASPGATNNPASAPAEVFINEWMAANESFMADPADGSPPDYEDWFELYNASGQTADLGGFYLTDVLANPTKWRIPDGTVIPPGGYLLVWADEESSQNGFNSDLHTNFRLNQNGETLALFSPDGIALDWVTFGPQTNNLAQGRFPDAAPNIVTLTNPTPRAPNRWFTTNTAPILAAMPDRTIEEGALLSFHVQANDADLPAQPLQYNLLTDSPAGASIDPTNGVFSWIPSEAQGPGVYPVTITVHDLPPTGFPSLSATQSFQVTVLEVNNPPLLAPLPSQVIEEGVPLVLTNSAIDPDFDAPLLVFSLAGQLPDGMQIDAVTGTITWTPAENQGPGNYQVHVRVTESVEPSLSDSKPVAIYVQEVNAAPIVTGPTSYTAHAGSPFHLKIQAEDVDQPANHLRFALEPGAPEGAAVDEITGWFQWTPPLTHVQGTNFVQLRVTDDGNPPLTTLAMINITLADPLRIVDAQFFTNQGLHLRWMAIPGATYQVETKHQLDDVNWAPVGKPVCPNDLQATFIDTAPTPRQNFYRIRRLE